MGRFPSLLCGTLALGLAALGCVEPKVGPPVSPLAPSPLVVEPARATLSPGQGTDFKAKGRDGSTPAVTWAAPDGGTVDAAGHFTAPASPGAFSVQAKAFGGRVASAQVEVVALPRGPVTAPEHVNAGAHGVQASVPVQPGATYAWTLDGGTPVGDAHGPTLTFNAGAGPKVVLACKVVNAAGLGMTTSLEVPLVPGVTLAVSPKTAVMTAGSTRKFGFTLDGGRTGDVAWSVLEPAGGKVDAAGRYQAPATPGEYTVQVQAKDDPSVKDTLAVKVVAAPKGPIRGPRKPGAHDKGLAASVPDQAGCTYAWKVTGGQITGGGDGNRVTFDAGDGPKLTLVCTVTNEAGESLESRLELTVGN